MDEAFIILNPFEFTVSPELEQKPAEEIQEESSLIQKSISKTKEDENVIDLESFYNISNLKKQA